MYTWNVVAGGVFSFVAAMGIGANDVANAYARSVYAPEVGVDKC